MKLRPLISSCFVTALALSACGNDKKELTAPATSAPVASTPEATVAPTTSASSAETAATETAVPEAESTDGAVDESAVDEPTDSAFGGLSEVEVTESEATTSETTGSATGDSVAAIGDGEDILDSASALAEALLAGELQTAYRALPERCRADVTPAEFSKKIEAALAPFREIAPGLSYSESSASGVEDTKKDVEVKLGIKAGGGSYVGNSKWVKEDAWRVDSCDAADVVIAAGFGEKRGLPAVTPDDVDDVAAMDKALAKPGPKAELVNADVGGTGVLEFRPTSWTRIESPLPLPEGESRGGVTVVETSGEFIAVSGEAVVTGKEPLSPFFVLSNSLITDGSDFYQSSDVDVVVKAAGGQPISGDLAAGSKTNIILVFEVPKGFEPKFVVGTASFGSTPYTATDISALSKS